MIAYDISKLMSSLRSF